MSTAYRECAKAKERKTPAGGLVMAINEESIDESLAHRRLQREIAFHHALVVAGVRAQGSRMEDHRAKTGPIVVVPPVDITALLLRRHSEAAE